MSQSLLTSSLALGLFLSTVTASYVQYSTVPGFFLQDDAATVPANFSYVATNFGLINQVYTTDATFDPQGTKPGWARFENYVKSINYAASSGTGYKVFYFGRHGEGYHNAAETFYGTPAWNCYWAELDGNATVSWDDAEITPNGAAQAVIANNFWKSQMANQGQSIPQSFYTSPLTRCLHTAALTFSDIVVPFTPLVKELFREGISMHTCDRRSSRTHIQTNYPAYRIEPGFTENDELWKGFEAETNAAQDKRSKTVLDAVFGSDNSVFLSVTSHSGEIASILRVLGHQVFGLVTGAVIPVLVKYETVADAPATSSISSWTSQATCTVPPITSLSTGGCICPTATATISATPTQSPQGTGAMTTYTPAASGSGAPYPISNSNGTVPAAGSGTGSVVAPTAYATGVASVLNVKDYVSLAAGAVGVFLLFAL